MKEWFTPADFAALRLPFTPHTKRGVNELADRNHWRRPELEFPRNPGGVWRRYEGRGGGYEYRAAVLNSQAQAALSRKLAKDAAPPAPPVDARDDMRRASVWEAYEKASTRLKEEAKRRLDALLAAEKLVLAGTERNVAMMVASAEFGVSERTLWNWRERTYGRPREDWLAWLVPSYAGRRAEAACDPKALEFIAEDHLRPERPPFSDCYRRLQAVAAEQGWVIPSEKTLRRRIEALPKAVKVYKRDGQDALKRLFPAQERDKTGLHALEAVNADGHKFDVFVRWPGDKTAIRPMLVAWADIYSGMILSWRLDRGETAQTVMLAFGDLVDRWGIPDHAFLDNGRAFASKWVSGGAQTRYRFKIRPTDPDGILTSLGVQIHWTTPYHGQAKPIERAFRDLASTISKDPRLAGAWTGNTIANKPANYGSRAVPLDLFERVVAEGITEHNSRIGRRSRVADGRSLEQAFLASYEKAPVRRAMPAQRNLWLLAAEGVSVRKQDGTIHLFGNRYFADALVDLAGEKVVARFDPDRLQDGLRVYTLRGVFVADAECIELAQFLSADDAKRQARKIKAHVAHTKALADLVTGTSLDEQARLHDAAMRSVKPQPAPETRIVRPIFRRGGGAAAAAVAQPEFDRDDTLVAFGRGLRALENREGADD